MPKVNKIASDRDMPYVSRKYECSEAGVCPCSGHDSSIDFYKMHHGSDSDCSDEEHDSGSSDFSNSGSDDCM